MSPRDSADCRLCPKCLRELPAEEFAFRDRESGRRQSRCRDCGREYSRAHYRADPAPYIERARVSNIGIRQRKREIVARLRTQSCMDCGGTFPPCCMEFDHRSGRTITGRGSPEAIANMKGSTLSLSRLEEELAKCDVVCANCHAIRTDRRRRDGSF